MSADHELIARLVAPPGEPLRLRARLPLLLLDEPFSAVDALTRIKLQDMVAELARLRAAVPAMF